MAVSSNIRRLPVILVSLLILYSGYILVTCIPQQAALHTWLLELAVSISLFFVFSWSFLSVVLSVSSVAADANRLVQLQLGINLLQRESNGDIRFCDICKAIKPDRAYHSSISGKCILKLDRISNLK